MSKLHTSINEYKKIYDYERDFKSLRNCKSFSGDDDDQILMSEFLVEADHIGVIIWCLEQNGTIEDSFPIFKQFKLYRTSEAIKRYGNKNKTESLSILGCLTKLEEVDEFYRVLGQLERLILQDWHTFWYDDVKRGQELVDQFRIDQRSYLFKLLK
jgi:hypothetical protein